ncbi:hypothetical protein TIFTF001_022668 [Ficus carica]|uniref:3-ketoacyl-CoA synthase n=1 Tax=Ficus carica TaxID=3494 RepID=A0AA88AEW9_FICCA|nr:hypothetical protein TIFTF001_022668 [Ficus carica]
MARDEKKQFSAEIVKSSSLDDRSTHFSVKVQLAPRDFLGSIRLKYVKLGYSYLICPRLCLLIASILVVSLSTSVELGKLKWENFCPQFDLMDGLFLVGLLVVIMYVYLDLTPKPTYLLDFACYRPPNDLKVSKDEFIELARKSGNFSEASIEFQQRILKSCGIGNESYMPRVVFRPGYKITLSDGREEAATVMFGAINELLAATKIKPKDIGILVVNCGVLNTTPSLSSMVINHFKLRNDVQSFNLGGMGCAAGIVAIDVAKDLLKEYPSTYALVVSTEAVSFTWYKGNDRDKLISNCFLRMGAAAMLLSSSRLHRWQAKYELRQILQTHQGRQDTSFRSMRIVEDAKGTQGVSINRNLVEAFLSCVSWHLKILTNKTGLLEHICVMAMSKKVLNEIERKLELTEDHMEASRRTLERFGNTSSSSTWYEMAYLESSAKIKNSHRIWQISFGSRIKCDSLIWKALKNVGRTNRSPWN